MDSQQNKLLEQYGRTQQRIPGARDILQLSLLRNSTATAYGLELARAQLKANGNGFRGQQMNIPGAPEFGIFQYMVGSELDDYIVARPYNGEAQYGDNVYIAKPPGLARFDYDGFNTNNLADGSWWLMTALSSNARSLTNIDTGEVEIQRITPDYQAFDSLRILAVRNVGGFNPFFEGSTAINPDTVTPDTPEGLVIGNVEWLDCNIGGRCWAVDPNAQLSDFA